MTLTEAADQLHVAPSTLRHQARKGKLKVRRMGGRLFVSEAEVARYRTTSQRQGESDGPTDRT